MDTLGSLCDKLVITDLKLWHTQEKLREQDDDALRTKNASLLVQRQRLIKAIDELFESIRKGEDVVLTNPSNKLY